MRLCSLAVILSCYNELVECRSIISCFTGFWSREIPRPMTYAPSNVPAEHCDFLIYAFVTINRATWELDHRYRLADISLGGFRDAVALKERNPNLKVILSVGGVPYQGHGDPLHFSEMMMTEDRRARFVNSTIRFLTEHGFDGFELHWYYPGSGGGLQQDKENLVKLVKELRTALDMNDLKLLITVPFLRHELEAGFKVAELNKYVDFFHVRTLGMNVYDKRHVDNSSPLERRSFDVSGTQAGEENVESVLNVYTEMGASREKLLFGIPFEGHVFLLDDVEKDYLKAPSSSRSYQAGRYSRIPGLLSYHEICSRIQSGKWIQKRDQESCVPYAVNRETREWVSYDDEQTLIYKVCFAATEGYAGVFVWLLEYDDFRGVCGEKHGLLKTLRRLMDTPCLNKTQCT